MDKLWEWAIEEIRGMRDAPGAMVALLVIGLAFGFWLASRFYAERLAVLQERADEFKSQSDLNPALLILCDSEADRDARIAQMQGWQPVIGPPANQSARAIWWLVPKTPEESYTDTSGNPIVVDAAPHAVYDVPYGQWGALWKAIYRRPLPSPPESA